jgi:probable F420-dependent oxidoreductase
MRFGIGLPTAGAAANGPDLIHLAQRAEVLGYESVWSGDHLIMPTAAITQYPYTADGSFARPPSEGFLEPFTLLAYVAGATRSIKLGMTVIILPYRNPIVQAKMLACLDILSGGRLICGVGVGWLEKEFQVLQASFKDRGPVSDEYLEIFKILWTQDNPEFHGKFYDFDGIAFWPKPTQRPHPPIWVGGHSRRAIRRAVRYGDAWHPTRQTPDFVQQYVPYLHAEAARQGRDPNTLTISLKRSLHFTDIGLSGEALSRSNHALIGRTPDVIDDVRRCRDIGIEQLTFDFRTGRVDDMLAIIEHFAAAVVPAI